MSSAPTPRVPSSDTPDSRETIRLSDSQRTPDAGAPLESDDDRPAVSAHRTRFGPYQIRDEISRGGMGIVYRAFHPEMDRDVALKVMRAGWQAEREEVVRFEREARAMASLQHPGIVRVLDSGTVEGTPYYAMELIEGQPLDELIRGRILTRAETVRLAVEICEALQHAHEHGILHRDLKPGNVLVDQNNRAKLFDFGLAKLLSSDSTQLTQSGWIVGTPNYMSPEQARGKPLTTASDIFSMGALFYEMLCGELAFSGQDGNEVLRAIIESQPPPPSTHDPTIDATLDAICLKALQKLPDDRYLSAKVMALDISNHSRRDRMIAHHSGLLRRLSKHVRRNRGGWLALLVGLLLIAALVAWRVRVIDGYRRRIDALEEDVHALTRSRSLARRQVRTRQARVDYFRGLYLVEQGRLNEALLLFREAWRQDPDFAEARAQLATTLHLLGKRALERDKPQQAARHLREAVRQDPSQAGAYLLLMDVYWHLHDLDRARQYGKTYVLRRPRDLKGHLRLGQVELEAGRLGTARQRARLALGLDRQSAGAWSLLGGVTLAAGSAEEAIPHLTRSIKLEASWEALDRRAHARYVLGRLEKALADTQQALKLASGQIRTLLLQGLIHARMTRTEKAQACFEQVLAGRARTPHETTICHAHALSRLGRNRDALAAIRQWRRMDPASGEPLRLAARIHEGMQDWTAARRAWVDVLRRRPRDKEALAALARLRDR